MRDRDVVHSLSEEAFATAKIFANDFIRSGVRLPIEKRSRFVQLSSEIIAVGRTFLSNISSPKPSVHISSNEMKGVPYSRRFFTMRGLEVARNDPLVHRILSSVDEEATRQKIYIASKSSTDEQVHTLEALLKARAGLARLVGYDSFAAMSLDDKMAQNPGMCSFAGCVCILTMFKSL